MYRYSEDLRLCLIPSEVKNIWQQQQQVQWPRQLHLHQQKQKLFLCSRITTATLGKLSKEFNQVRMWLILHKFSNLRDFPFCWKHPLVNWIKWSIWQTLHNISSIANYRNHSQEDSFLPQSRKTKSYQDRKGNFQCLAFSTFSWWSSMSSLT